MIKMICPICNSKNTKIIYSKFPGYLENTFYKIIVCNKCEIQFIPTKDIDLEIYNKIYGTTGITGYDRYYNYAEKIKKINTPLAWLTKQEISYHVFTAIPSKKQKILEIGCGYGYLTFALNKAGHNAIGIDISKKAIKYAKQNFNNKNYKVGTINSINSDKFDIIIATELIEHLTDYNSFMSKCYELLNEKGKILLSTPNKDYFKKNRIWLTDKPPVHTIWFSKKSMKIFAKNNNFECRFLKLTEFKSNANELLIKLNLDLRTQKHSHVIYKQKKVENSSKRYKLIKMIANMRLIKKTSNYILSKITNEKPILCIEMIKYGNIKKN